MGVFKEGFIELLWPSSRECPVCGLKGDYSSYPACPTCLLEFVEWSGFQCEYCGYPTRAELDCPRCERLGRPFESARAVGIFRGGMRTAIHRFKYGRERALADVFAFLMAEMIQAEFSDVRFDLVLPVPMHPSSKRERGFNQAEELARRVAGRLGMRFSPRGIRRTRRTASQTVLNLAERIQNLRGAFSSDPHVVRGKRVLLVDDVITTGTTVGECSRSLSRSGALAVYVATVATASY